MTFDDITPLKNVCNSVLAAHCTVLDKDLWNSLNTEFHIYPHIKKDYFSYFSPRAAMPAQMAYSLRFLVLDKRRPCFRLVWSSEIYHSLWYFWLCTVKYIKYFTHPEIKQNHSSAVNLSLWVKCGPWRTDSARSCLMNLRAVLFTCEEFSCAAGLWNESKVPRVCVGRLMWEHTFVYFFFHCSVLLIVCALVCSLLLADSRLHYGWSERERERGVSMWHGVFWSMLLIELMCHWDLKNIRPPSLKTRPQ